MSDKELTARASGLFDATGNYWSRQITKNERKELWEQAFTVTHIGNLAVLEIEPSDFGSFVVSHRCSGLVLYAGSIVWEGTGNQIYPAVPIHPDALARTSGKIASPEQLDIIIGPGAYVDEKEGIAAWKSIQDLNLVQELATGPYKVLVYLYPRTVGMFSPDNADWVIFVYRDPVSETDTHPTSTPTPEPTPTYVSSLPTISPLTSPLQTPTPIVIGPVTSVPDPLDGTQWELVAFEDMESPPNIPEQHRFIGEFQKGGLGFDGGCNSISGYYVLEGTSITITFSKRTEMECNFGPDFNAVEELLFTSMSTYQSYAIEANQLRIRYDDGVLVFQRLED